MNVQQTLNFPVKIKFKFSKFCYGIVESKIKKKKNSSKNENSNKISKKILGSAVYYLLKNSVFLFRISQKKAEWSADDLQNRITSYNQD